MIKIQKSDWRIVLIEGSWVVKFKCPKCKIEQQIDHEISDLGVLTPSVLCGAECGFHDSVFLEDYPEPLQGGGEK